MGRGASITEATKRSICADYALTPRPSILAKKYNCNPVTISRIIRTMRLAPIAPDVMQDRQSWKQELSNLSVNAVRRALTDGNDVYKSASVAQTHLKGVGEYEPDGSLIQFQQVVAGIPAEWRKELAQASDQDEERTPP